MRILPATGPDRDNPSTTLRIDTRIDTRSSSAPPDVSPERRAALERELDRVQTALLAERASFIPLLSALLLTQGLFLIAFCLLLSAPAVPALNARLLMAGVAGAAATATLLVWLLLRPMREAMSGLRNQRRDLEAKLYKDFRRRPTFAPRSLLTRSLAGLAASALPLLFMAAWIALAIFALAAPPRTATADAATAAPAVQRARPRAAPVVTRGSETVPIAASAETPAARPDDLYR
jgi:hypothetical protein